MIQSRGKMRPITESTRWRLRKQATARTEMAFQLIPCTHQGGGRDVALGVGRQRDRASPLSANTTALNVAVVGSA